MTPAARAAAAIAALERILQGEAAEKALTNWGRASRYAGSGDRAAVRDIVYDCLRRRRSFGALGGGETARGLVLGAARAAGAEAAWFDGSAYGPGLADDPPGRSPQGTEALDCPDWLAPRLRVSLGEDFSAVMQALQRRAPVFVRVNAARASLAEAQAALQADGIVTVPHPLAKTALEVTENARKIQNSAAYGAGLVELQDVSSQAVAEAVPLRDGDKVLDLCAGGGGKTLALAARAKVEMFAHDAHVHRMADLAARTDRAGTKVTLARNPENAAPFDVVLADVPCSGSGSWRRDPEGKWLLTEDKLADLLRVQTEILDRAATLLRPGGLLAYATCSLLRDENQDQVAAFLSHHLGWTLQATRSYSPLQGGDGFGLAILARP
jgi:16S rRNA (cytosine967-C5)-methyltransferase